MRFVTIALAAATLLPLTSYAVLGGCAHDRLILCHVASRCSSTPSTSTRGVNQPGYIPSTAAYSAHESRDADGITVSMYCRITSSSQSHGKAPCGRT